MTLNKSILSGFLVWLMFMGIFSMTLAHAGSGPSDVLVVTGTITNDQGKPLKDVILQFFINGKKIHIEEEVTTSKSGGYKAELTLPKGSLAGAKIQIEAEKPSFKNSGHISLKNIVWERSEENGVDYYLALRNFSLVRVITPAFWIASLVLLAVYALIAF